MSVIGCRLWPLRADRTPQPHTLHRTDPFWVVDNGTIHRGQKAIERLVARWPTLVLVHLPVHASWLNQIEIYFSILARKALTPSHFASLDELDDRVIGFQERYRVTARPFNWTFTRDDLRTLIARL